MIKTKVAFLKGQLLSSQSEPFKKYSKSPRVWLEKSRLFKQATIVLIMLENISWWGKNILTEQNRKFIFSCSTLNLSGKTKYSNTK